MIETNTHGVFIRTDEDGEVYILDDAAHAWGMSGELNLSSRAALESLQAAITDHLVAVG